MHSHEVQEPMIGSTLAHIHRWILVEQAGMWPARPRVEDLRVDDRVREMIQRTLQKPGTRLQLIRNASSSVSSTPSIFLCEDNILYVADANTTELTPQEMSTYSESMILVCTHGSRDRCCGTLGGAIYAKAYKKAPKKIWQASHLGGHRFAPTLLVLPQGMMYGRIETEDIPSLLAHPKDLPFSCAKLRGVPQWPYEIQVAVHQLWSEGKDGLRSFSSSIMEENRWAVSVTCGEEEYSFVVYKESMGVSIAASCADPKLKELFRYRCHRA
jgi:hypothetical protein